MGFQFVANVFMDGAVGARLSGKADVVESHGDGEAASIHDCPKCLDGDIQVFARGNIGVDLEALEYIAKKDWYCDLSQ